MYFPICKKKKKRKIISRWNNFAIENQKTVYSTSICELRFPRGNPWNFSHTQYRTYKFSWLIELYIRDVIKTVSSKENMPMNLLFIPGNKDNIGYSKILWGSSWESKVKPENRLWSVSMLESLGWAEQRTKNSHRSGVCWVQKNSFSFEW